jgi:hypothetical protein
VALSDLEVGFIHLNPQQWTKQNWCLGGFWVTQPGFLGFCVAFFFFLVQVYEPTNNPLIVEVDAHSIGGLSFTPGESPEGGPFPNASLPQVVALSRGPSFPEGQALPQYFFGHGQIFLKCFFFFETNGQNPFQGE